MPGDPTRAGAVPATPPGGVRLRSAQGRWVLFATVLGSAVVGIEATALNVATPAIGEDFDAPLSSLQWVLTAYTLTLAGLLLLGGSLGDRYGRRRLLVVGVVWFAAASLLCAVAPDVETLIAARALQGVGGALLTPGSLAIIQASFHRDDRAAAIGAWSGLGGVATAVGPLLGGYLVDAASWRWIFVVNLPVAAAVILVTVRHVPETRDPAHVPLDPVGAALAAVAPRRGDLRPHRGAREGVGGPRRRDGPRRRAGRPRGVRRRRAPVEPPDAAPSIFGSRQFTAANLVTLVVYAALGGALFLVAIQLQQVVGYTALGSGLALLPLTIVLLLLSARAGRLAQRIGPRLPMTAGPLGAAAGLALMTRIDAGAAYTTDVLPAVLVFALGLSLTVAPLTATVLAAAPDAQAGVASGVNNDVARIGGLLAVAVLPPVAGISGADYLDPAAFGDGFTVAIWISAALCAAGGVLAALTIRRPAADDPAPEPCFGCPVSGPSSPVAAGAAPAT